MHRLDLSSRQVAMITSLPTPPPALASCDAEHPCASVDLERPTLPTPFSRSPGFPVDNARGRRRLHCNVNDGSINLLNDN